MNLKKIIYISSVLLILIACNNNNTEEKGKALARVSDKYLYLSDLEDFIPDKINPSDSILMAEDYIKKWIQKELLIQKAEENLSNDQKNVSKELEEYRNSLIIYKYKNELVAQKMDTTVSDSEIKDYYNNNTGNFILNRNIVKGIYLKIPVEVANPEQLKLYCGNESDENFRDLKEYCLQYAKAFDSFNDLWIDFDYIINFIPTEITDQKRFLERNTMLEASDSDYYYMVCIRDYRLAGQTAPVDYVGGQIKNLILNRRKLTFLKNVEQDIYNEGIRNNKFNIYDVEK
ncbi:MAG: hypothetical protein JXR31_14395 [Prolixibacteraceae bacterium]|nr:hypothetical protein [Prolixibacteraceae bacterium]MBN2775441.1 hypothetical protein [Prolixibacteraceae bacterium]